MFDENKVAIGVEVKRNGAIIDIAARKEVILSAGTVGSAKILMLSGIGPRKHLQDNRVLMCSPRTCFCSDCGNTCKV